MSTPPSLSEQVAAYYKQKEPYLALLRKADANMTSLSPEEAAAEYEKVSERIRDPDAPAKPNHKDNIYPDPRMPSRVALVRRKRIEVKKEDLQGEIDAPAVRKMILDMREEAAKGKDKEAKQAWADMDRMLKEGVGVGKSKEESKGPAEGKGKKKGKK